MSCEEAGAERLDPPRAALGGDQGGWGDQGGDQACKEREQEGQK